MFFLVGIGVIIQTTLTINQQNSQASLIGGIIVMLGGIFVAIKIAVKSKRKEIRHGNNQFFYKKHKQDSENSLDFDSSQGCGLYFVFYVQIIFLEN